MMKKKHTVPSPAPIPAYTSLMISQYFAIHNITRHLCLIAYNLYNHSVCNSYFYGFNNRNTFS